MFIGLCIPCPLDLIFRTRHSVHGIGTYLNNFMKLLTCVYSNVIDVGALDAHNMEQHEYFDRARIYR